MSIGSVSTESIAAYFAPLDSLLSQASKAKGAGAAHAPQSLPQDKNQLSPFAQILGSLQQLQQTNPDQFQQLATKISTNLEKRPEKFRFFFFQKFSAERYEFSTALPLPNTTRWIPAGSSTKVSSGVRIVQLRSTSVV